MKKLKEMSAEELKAISRKLEVDEIIEVGDWYESDWKTKKVVFATYSAGESDQFGKWWRPTR